MFGGEGLTSAAKAWSSDFLVIGPVFRVQGTDARVQGLGVRGLHENPPIDVEQPENVGFTCKGFGFTFFVFRARGWVAPPEACTSFRAHPHPNRVRFRVLILWCTGVVICGESDDRTSSRVLRAHAQTPDNTISNPEKGF